MRKAAAASIDKLAVAFGDDSGIPSSFLDIALHVLEESLQSNEWVVVESSILVIGAIAKGCEVGLNANTPVLIRMLVYQLADHPQSLVRQIVAWTLSRLSSWIMDPVNVIIDTVLTTIMKLIDDDVMPVRGAASSALSTLLEHGSVEVFQPFIASIVEQMAIALSRGAEEDCLDVMVDVLGTMAEEGHLKGHALLGNHVLGVLMGQWRGFDAHSRNHKSLFVIMDTVATTVASIGVDCLPNAREIHDTAVAIFEAAHKSDNAQDLDERDVSALVCVIDLLSSLAEGLGHDEAESILSGAEVIDAVIRIASFPDNPSDLLRSAYAMIGDYARVCFPAVEPHALAVIPHIMATVARPHPAGASLSQNGVWTLGILATQIGEEFEPFVDSLLPVLCKHMGGSCTPQMKATVATVIGRLAAIFPARISPMIVENNEFSFAGWVASIPCEATESMFAVHGLHRMASDDPDVFIPLFTANANDVLRVVAAFSEDDLTKHPELSREVTDLCQWLKDELDEPDWIIAMANLELKQGPSA